ncbi:MAG: SDR family NAD(P)-dependent oxidoreductase, partial [Gammaproteobacteria bacterium]|nr:SDR family NAD(P)-dependent oxidoreductase [Gammaproteobacteria bacterium]MYK27119.1 SDR family NAD(P)-dependent oxidoreductase [Gammaproteobacteria bacterium]
MRGKVILITGGTSGIGLAVAQRCAIEGAAVVIAARNKRESVVE